MIVNSSKGSNIAGALSYVEGPGRDQVEERATLISWNGFGFDPENEQEYELAKRLMIQNGTREMQGEKDRYCELDCLHLSLSWDPKQSPPDVEEKREAAKAALKALGMENAMHLTYDHSDKEHPHIHIVASRVDPETGMAYDDSYRVVKSLQWSREKEREDAERGLRLLPEAMRRFHEPYQEPTLEAVQGLYKAREQEQNRNYFATREQQKEVESRYNATSELYRTHHREAFWKEAKAAWKALTQKEERKMANDGVAAGPLHAEATKEPPKEKVRANDNEPWMRDLVKMVFEPNRRAFEAAKLPEREPKMPEPKRTVADRIIDKAMALSAGPDATLARRLEKKADRGLDR